MHALSKLSWDIPVIQVMPALHLSSLVNHPATHAPGSRWPSPGPQSPTAWLCGPLCPRRRRAAKVTGRGVDGEDLWLKLRHEAATANRCPPLLVLTVKRMNMGSWSCVRFPGALVLGGMAGIPAPRDRTHCELSAQAGRDRGAGGMAAESHVCTCLHRTAPRPPQAPRHAMPSFFTAWIRGGRRAAARDVQEGSGVLFLLLRY